VNWVFHPGASEEMEESATWYETRKPGLGDEFLSEVQDTIDRILKQPNKWRTVYRDVRRCRLERFPFAVLYRARSERVEIVAIAHDRRRTGYWEGRVGQ